MNKFYKTKNNLFKSRNKNIEYLKSLTERESNILNENLTKQNNNNNYFNTITNFYNNKISSNKIIKKHNNLEAIDINIYQTDKKNIFIYNMMKNFNHLDTINFTGKNDNLNKLNKDNFNLSKIITKFENYKNNKINKINKFTLDSFKYKKKNSNKIKKPKKIILSSENLLQINYNSIDELIRTKKIKNKINSLDLKYKKINIKKIQKDSIKILSKEKNKNNNDFIKNLYNNYFIQKNKNKRLIDKINNISQDKISKMKNKKKDENKILKKTKSSINLITNYSLINNIKDFKYKFNKFQTSSNFFKFKINLNNFKKKENKKYTFDINNIIYNVIENNKKAAEFKSSNYFNKLGTDYMNFHMKTINYNSSNSQKKYHNYNINNNNNNNNINFDNNKRTTFNSIKIILTNPLEWKKHEEIWKNILNLSFISMEIEKYLIPPNENEVLISTYLKLNSKLLNFVSYEKKNNNYYLYFYIDDNIKNPKLEMKKWKDAYKEVLLRWHPDKLSAFLKEIVLKNDEIKKILKKKSTMIINNMNNKFKYIIEILRKIYNYQNIKNNNNDN